MANQRGIKPLNEKHGALMPRLVEPLVYARHGRELMG